MTLSVKVRILLALAGLSVSIPVGVINNSDSLLSKTLSNVSSRYHLTANNDLEGPRHITMRRFDSVLSSVKETDVLDEMLRIRDNVDSQFQQRRLLSYDQKVLSIAFGIIEVVEGGYKKRAYNDGFGTITVGFGSTFIYDKKTGEKRRVKRSDKLSVVESKKLKERIVKEDFEFLERFLAKNAVELNSLSKAALVSFIYNIGKDGFLRSDVARLLAKGKITKAVNVMKTSYVTSKGKKAGGLVRRRAVEAKLLSTSILGKKKEPSFI
jgi:hypothetical protein